MLLLKAGARGNSQFRTHYWNLPFGKEFKLSIFNRIKLLPQLSQVVCEVQFKHRPERS